MNYIARRRRARRELHVPHRQDHPAAGNFAGAGEEITHEGKTDLLTKFISKKNNRASGVLIVKDGGTAFEFRRGKRRAGRVRPKAEGAAAEN